MAYDHISDFDYELPDCLIAQFPLPERSSSRLLCIDANRQSIISRQFSDILSSLSSNDLLVINNTKVFPARLYGQKSTGGKIECLVERVLSSTRALVHLKSSKSPKPGSVLHFENALEATVHDREGDLFLLDFDCKSSLLETLEEVGHIPLPPYINRNDLQEDRDRYQTVYAKHPGAVAAPTAGLHFTASLLEKIKAKGIKIATVTLHVGAGTFQPLRVEKVDDHEIHQEYIDVDEQTCQAIQTCREKGGRVVAVGTTTLRALESASAGGVTSSYQGDTDLFIRPGYEFQCVDALITNFHLPKSSLLMLVTAFGGYDLIMKAYRQAIAEEYRFYSYGDAMFIEREAV